MAQVGSKTRILGVLLAGIAGVLAGCSSQPAPPPQAPVPNQSQTSAPAVAFNPPKISDLKEDDEYGKFVKLGYNLMTQTKKYAPDLVGNNLSCSSCHANAGTVENEWPLVGSAAVYPQYRNREASVVTLEDRIAQCFTYSLDGKPPAPDSVEMRAIVSYLTYISKGQPIGEKAPWLGKKIEPSKNPNPENGKQIYEKACASCHGVNGQGGAGPALWGPDSFNNGAGMSKIQNLASFIKFAMPKAEMGGVKPGSLTDQEASDIAAFILGHDRPVFKGESKYPSINDFKIK